ncbi:MAG: TPM domain-containing protein [Candidatus Firestonebacteria bacterium]|nr:TPM domain-containing protein [Candidatus Firestonebacteria bacterium]
MRKIFWVVSSVLCLIASSPIWAKMPTKPEGRVSDFAEMLTESEEAALQDLSERLEKATGAQLAVVTVPELDGLTAEEYANRLFKLWGVGRKGQDDGVLFLVALKEGRARIEVGYGLESVLNDGKVGRILDEAVMPRLKAMNYGEGIQAGAERIAEAVSGNADWGKTVPATSVPTAEEPLPKWLKIAFPLLMGLFVTLGFLSLGAGLRGDWKSVVWGALFGGIPLGLSVLAAPALGFPEVILPIWGLIMAVVGAVFGKRFLARYGGSWRVRVSVGFGGKGRGSGQSGSSGGFGGGSSGGGGAGR